MRLSRSTHKIIDEIEEACECSDDDEGIAKFFRVPMYEVAAIRSAYEDRRESQRTDEEAGSRALKLALDSLFRNWEIEHGYKKGAGVILVPAGFDPAIERESA